MRLLLLLLGGMVIAILVGGITSMVSGDRCPELAPASCQTQSAAPRSYPNCEAADPLARELPQPHAQAGGRDTRPGASRP